MSNTNQIICAMEKKVSKIEKFVQSLENEQVMKSKGFQLYSGGQVVTDAFAAADKNKHNKHCCNDGSACQSTTQDSGLR